MNHEGPGRFALETESGARIVVEDGRIAPASEAAGRTIGLGAAEIRPGLINAHDHLTFNHYPRLGAPPYSSLYEWARDVQERFVAAVERHRTLGPRITVLFGVLKNLLGGVTRVVHHDRWSAELDGDLPLHVERVRVVHSLGLEGDVEAARDPDGELGHLPLCMHLAEGVDPASAEEVREASRRGLLGPDLLAVHLVGVDEEGMELLRESGVAFVWCPSSNLHLYGSTAPSRLFRAGLDLLLGTDSLISAAGTLLHELGAARSLGCVDDETLEAAVGAVPARRLGLRTPSLDAGEAADLVVLRRPLLEARPADVALVLVGGRPRLGERRFRPLFEDAGIPTETLEVGGEERLVEAPLGSVAREVFRLTPECRRILS